MLSLGPLHLKDIAVSPRRQKGRTEQQKEAFCQHREIEQQGT